MSQSNFTKNNNSGPQEKDKPTRYLVRHYHKPLPQMPGEEVIVTYNCESPRALEFAINTASRYGGIIYADCGDVYDPALDRWSMDCHFVRSYAAKKRLDRDQEQESVLPSIPV